MAKKKQKKLSRWLGFSLIELLVVATIIIVLVGVAVVNFGRTSRGSRDNRREKDALQLRSALEQYYEVYDEYPVASSLSNLMSNSAFTEFMQSTSIQDPVNSGIYQYTVSSNVNSFQVCYQQEAVSGIKCNTNLSNQSGTVLPTSAPTATPFATQGCPPGNGGGGPPPPCPAI